MENLNTSNRSAKLAPLEGVLVLEDGFTLPGRLAGAPLPDYTAGDHGYGEVVFNTSLTGYQEILSDPSYYGQIVCMTTAHLGNTGMNPEDPESRKIWCAGWVVNELEEIPSNWRSRGTLEAALREAGVPALTGVDTRALTRHLRSLGVVRGILLRAEDASKAPALLAALPKFEGRDLISEVSTRDRYEWPENPTHPRHKVAVLDFGVKHGLLRSLAARGCGLTVFPAATKAETLLTGGFDGVFLSNGPGDPEAAPYAAETVRGILGKLPIFGVCMGHQVLGLAVGGKTFKLKFGHRGGNQPVFAHEAGRVEISSHNHGYAVDPTTLPDWVKTSHVNLNDKTCEGLAIPSKRAFSVQYHPEACPGPHDSMLLFDQFVELMQTKQGA